MPGHLTCLTDFGSYIRFKMCQSYEYDTAVYARVTQSSEHVRI